MTDQDSNMSHKFYYFEMFSLLELKKSIECLTRQPRRNCGNVFYMLLSLKNLLEKDYLLFIDKWVHEALFILEA